MAYPDLAKLYGVAGYPTLRYFKDKEVQVMDGANAGRTADEVLGQCQAVSSTVVRVVRHVKGERYRQ